LDLVVQPGLDPALAAATDRHLMQAVRLREREAALHVYDLAGDVVSLGRYHLAPESDPDAGVRLARRHGGGRVWPAGEGFVGFSLILPHRSALVGDDPLALTPERALNRCVRGFLQGCRSARIDAFYPGRDVVTVDRRLLAAISLETDASGTALFEAVVADARDFSISSARVEAVDRKGVLSAPVHGPETATCLGDRLQADLGLEGVAALLERGYAEAFSLRPRFHELSAGERRAAQSTARGECSPAAWVQARRRRRELSNHGVSWIQLGVLETYWRAGADAAIEEILFAGDFIASSPALVELESRLRGCRCDAGAIGEVVEHVFGRPGSFVLGIGARTAFADAILSAVGT
jgi:lipoate-protein ligase A